MNNYPCDGPDGFCPYDAVGGYDCRNYCGLGVDECGDDEYYEEEQMQMDNCALSETMKEWLKKLYLEGAKEHQEYASNCHLFALGSETQDGSIQFEEFADKHREFARILENLAEELDLE
jgi:hypothetical protein